MKVKRERIKTYHSLLDVHKTEFIMESYEDIKEWTLNRKTDERFLKDELSTIERKSKAFLNEKGLPNTYSVLWNSSFQEHPDATHVEWENPDRSGGANLDRYIIGRLGYSESSMEGLAAQLIVNCKNILKEMDSKKPREDMIARSFYKLGRMSMLFDIFLSQKKKKVIQGKADKRKIWADKLAAYLVREDPNIMIYNVRKRVQEKPEEVKRATGWEIWIKDNKFYAKDPKDGKVQKLSSDTFRKEYLDRHKRMAKNKVSGK